MNSAVTIRQDQVLISLAQLGAAVADVPDMLRIVGTYMQGSIAKTFREEGSPAGSWPALADSTKKKKGYTAGHKLLILSGRLFGSITRSISGNRLTIGTGLVYAAVHQWGSGDRQGSAAGGGPKLQGNGVKVSAYDAARLRKFRQYGNDQRTDKNGKVRNVRVRAQGPDNLTRYSVGEHTRDQNIPARAYLVFRPEDRTNIEIAIENWLIAGKPTAVKA